MKKIALALLLALTTLSLFAQTGVIRRLNGTVELKKPGTSAFVPAKAGDSIDRNTVISTGFKSNALVAVGSTLVTVRPLTRLTLTEIRASAGVETLNVNLQAGRVRVDVNPPAGNRASMTVTSPIATASVRGTSFEFDTRNVRVNRGTVSFYGNQGIPMLVNAGAKSQINENGKAADPLEITAAALVPPAPIGTDVNIGTVSVPQIQSGGVFTIDLTY